MPRLGKLWMMNSFQMRQGVTLLDECVTLKGWQKFGSCFVIQGNMNTYTRHEEHEIMFHVSTMLPFSADDSQQVRLNLLYSFFDSL